MALSHTAISLVRLPLRLVGTAISAVAALMPGRTPEPAAPTPTDVTPQPMPEPRPAERATPVERPPAATRPAGTKKAAAKKTAAKLPAPVAQPEPAPVTDIDAHAADIEVDVTPADVAATMGSHLEERRPSPS